jgi:hypothetical protein
MSEPVSIPTFGDVETITIGELAIDDFVVSVPPQRGVRGVRVNSGLRDKREDYGTWTVSSGYRRPQMPVRSWVLMFKDPHMVGLNYPDDFTVQVRRPVKGDA